MSRAEHAPSPQRPPPPIAPDVDLRDLDGFMLNVEKLMASELWALSTGDEFKAAVALWCRAWKQLPAGSLPDDDRVLAAWSGAGPRWKKLKPMALRGFVLCDDGRLYHPVLCADAERAWKAKQQRKEAIQRRWERHRSNNGADTGEPSGDERPNPSRTYERDTAVSLPNYQGQGQGQGQGKDTKNPPKPPVAGGRAAEHPRFAEFWSAYPGRGDAANPRKPASERFARAVERGADPEQLVAAARAYAAKAQRTGIAGTERVAQATTWLNQERWRDEAASAGGGPAGSTAGAGDGGATGADEWAGIDLPAGADVARINVIWFGGGEDSRWVGRIRGWLQTGDWLRSFGPPPDAPCTEVPRPVLAAFGLASAGAKAA